MFGYEFGCSIFFSQTSEQKTAISNAEKNHQDIPQCLWIPLSPENQVIQDDPAKKQRKKKRNYYLRFCKRNTENKVRGIWFDAHQFNSHTALVHTPNNQ